MTARPEIAAFTGSVAVHEHALRRCDERGMPRAAVLTLVRARFDGQAGSVAMLLGSFPEHRGGLMTSNGDELWAVVRDHELVTVMFRRSTQPRMPDAFGVDRVVA